MTDHVERNADHGVWENKLSVPGMPYIFPQHTSAMAPAEGTDTPESSQVLLPALMTPHLGVESVTGARSVFIPSSSVNSGVSKLSVVFTHTYTYSIHTHMHISATFPRPSGMILLIMSEGGKG